ncbi:CAP domain-containing protein [Streptomyces sp. NPDC014986]|uniref:CAP domain-containing protein n=1 Tax=Streptomyces sp. NPDC014986 TaxID=3364934 RepID=UPI0036FEF59B
MGKHRHQQKYRRTVVAAVAMGVIGIPSVAMACTDWPAGGERQERSTAGPDTAGHRWGGPDRYGRWSNQRHGEPTAAPTGTPPGTPSATASPSTTGAPEHSSAEPSQKPTHKPSQKPKKTAPEASTSRPVTTAPEPTTAAPKPTTAAPKPTTAAPDPTAGASSPAATGGTQASGAVAGVVELVNAERGKAGCSPVKVNATLTEAAQKHSEDMAASGNMSHTGSDGSSPGDRITRAGYDWSTYGENVAYGYSTPEQVMAGWMTSPGHRENIVNCAFKEIGVGLAQPGGYWTQDFGTAR